MLIAKTSMVEGKLLLHTVLLNLESVDHVGELDSSKSLAEIIHFGLFIFVNMDHFIYRHKGNITLTVVCIGYIIRSISM